MKEIFISDLQRIKSPEGWYEAVIENRIKDGYEATRDDERMGYRLVKKEITLEEAKKLCDENVGIGYYIIGNELRQIIDIAKNEDRLVFKIKYDYRNRGKFKRCFDSFYCSFYNSARRLFNFKN